MRIIIHGGLSSSFVTSVSSLFVVIDFSKIKKQKQQNWTIQTIKAVPNM